MRRLSSALLPLAAVWVLLVPEPASARVSCGGHVPRAFRQATDVFRGRIEQPATVAEPLAPGVVGAPAVDLVVVVTRVFKGGLTVGDRVTVRWEGWQDPPNGRVGGCWVPGTENERYPFDMLVFAERGADGGLRVGNRSSSSRLAAVPQSRRLLARVAALARRRSR